jgi:hypothetical protein
MLNVSGSDVGRIPRSEPTMTRPTYNRVCQCCGTDFTARHSGAKWCHVNCRVQAYQCRKRGEPVRPAYSNRYAVDQALPVQWQEQSTSGHEARIWAGTAITRRQTDGYVNATAMCQANGKLWGHYIRADRTKDYLSALRQHLEWIPENLNARISPCMDAPELVVSIKGGIPDLQGTWVHPLLAVDLARWISPQFAVWMDGWFLESISKPQQPQQRLPLPPGIHVVANSPRQANWLWAQAVEDHISRALMAQIATGNRHQAQPAFQLHLLPAA